MSFDPRAERIRARLHSRMFAYRALFLQAKPNAPPTSARWWHLAFWRKPEGGDVAPNAEIVLRDLAAYCYAHKPTLKVSHVTQQSDALAMAFAEGRRDVFNRIIGLCNLNTEQINSIAQRSNDE